jgi:hypothetical protein
MEQEKEDVSETFDDWICELDEEIIQGGYGYERGEFTVYPELWRPAFIAGQTPREAFEASLKAYDDERKRRDREAAERWVQIQRKDAEAIAAYRAAREEGLKAGGGNV